MPAPVRHTCPDIDKALKLLKSARIECRDGIKASDKQSDDFDRYNSIENNLDTVADTLEDLRSSNDALRTWGHNLEKEIEQLKEELETVK